MRELAAIMLIPIIVNRYRNTALGICGSTSMGLYATCITTQWRGCHSSCCNCAWFRIKFGHTNLNGVLYFIENFVTIVLLRLFLQWVNDESTACIGIRCQWTYWTKILFLP